MCFYIQMPKQFIAKKKNKEETNKFKLDDLKKLFLY